MDPLAPAPRLFTIPAGTAFVDALARGLCAQHGAEADPLALARVTVLLPTRRSVRALREAFLRLGEGRPMVLPRIRAIGDVDEDELLLEGGDLDPEADLALAPAIPPLRRQVRLAQLLLATSRGRAHAPQDAAQATRLAQELCRLLDQIETERLDFGDIARLVPEMYAEHWQITLDFLSILRAQWPQTLGDGGFSEPAARRNALLEALARRWRERPPSGPVVAAGSTGSIPATADLLDIVARLPQGCVVLPGLDTWLDEAAWQALPPSHPQHGLKRLLDRFGVAREAVALWPACAGAADRPARALLLSEAMRPAETTEAWRDAALRLAAEAAAATQGLSRIDAPTPREEAGAIALILREALEVPGRRAALVTPDRALARRVATELRRWGVLVDDSAGTPLGETPPGMFLRALAAMAAERFAPVPLLSALKHPLAAGHLPPPAFRARVRLLERAVLRGPRPAAGLDGLRAAVSGLAKGDGRRAELLDWLDGLDAVLRPLAEGLAAPAIAAAELAERHFRAAEWLAASDEAPGALRLWAGEVGEAAAEFAAALIEALGDLAPIPGAVYPGLFEALIASEVVRPRHGRHPRLFIWGPLEARLQQVDVVVLGGLNEGTWPRESQMDAWLNRPMRTEFGLPAPEWRIGLSAHDFVQAAAAPCAVLTRARKVDGAPTVPSRWLLRLENLLRGMGAEAALEPERPYLAWFAALDDPGTAPQPATPPRPTPPLAARPRALGVTEIETLIRDPYAIYARHVLKLRPLDPLDAEPGPLERGTVIHRALEGFVRSCPGHLPADAEARLIALGRAHFAALGLPPSLLAFWLPRFVRLASWFVAFEHEQRKAARPLALEVSGRMNIPAPLGPFTLKAKADRIDRTADGRLLILDYKTGKAPSRREIEVGFAPQLPLEALLAAAGGFEAVPAAEVACLAYIELRGGDPPGKIAPFEDVATLVARTQAGVQRLIAAFDDPSTPYLSRPRPQFRRFGGDYDHLARVLEWAGAGEEP